jgi:hypothetical protein
MNEVLTCVKLIKMYAWEEPFAKSIKGEHGKVVINVGEVVINVRGGSAHNIVIFSLK